MTLTHPPILGSRLLHWRDEAACAAHAAVLARQAALADAFVTLRGPLGAGKTSYARHLLRALGVAGRIKSPSYALVETYQVGPLAIAHCDFYRFAGAQEFEDAGLRELFAAPGLKLVEWPEQAAGLLPLPDLQMQLAPGDGETEREVSLQAFTPRGVELLA